MNINAYAQQISLILLAILGAIFAVRAYQYRHEQRPVITWFGAGILLELLAFVSTRVPSRPFTPLLVGATLVQHLAFNIGMLFTFWAIQELLTGEPKRASLYSSILFGFISASLFIAILDIARLWLWSVLHPQMRPPTLNYSRVIPGGVNGVEWWVVVALYLCSNIIILGLALATVYTYLKTMRHNTGSPVYLCRRIICLSAFVFGAIGVGSVLIGTFLWPFGYVNFHAATTRIYHAGKTVAYAIAIIGFATPHRWLAWITLPLVRIIEQRRHNDKSLICYLHNQMIQVVPIVHLPISDELLREIRYDVEISDARDILWTYLQKGHMTAHEEAQWLHYLISEKTMFTVHGPYIPSSLPRNIARYNLQVARALRKISQEII